MPFENRGGFPLLKRLLSFDAANGISFIPKFPTKRIQISNIGTNPARLYFDPTVYNGDTGLTATDGFVTLPANTGFFNCEVEIGEPAVLQGQSVPPLPIGIYLRCGVAGQTTSVEMCLIARRG